MRIRQDELPGNAQARMKPADYLAEYNAYKAARDAAKLQEGIPAPFPPHEFMRVIYDKEERENESALMVELVAEFPEELPIQEIPI